MGLLLGLRAGGAQLDVLSEPYCGPRPDPSPILDRVLPTFRPDG